MSNSFNFNAQISPELSNDSKGYLTCAVSALEAWCNYEVGDNKSSQLLDYRIADTIRVDNTFFREGVEFLWASVEGMHNIRYVLGEKLGLDNYDSAATKHADAKNARAYVFGHRGDAEEINYNINNFNNRFESVASKADELSGEEVISEVHVYLKKFIEGFDSEEFFTLFLANLSKHPEFSAWLFSARCTIELASQCIASIYSGKDMGDGYDKIHDIIDALQQKGFDLQDSNVSMFLTCITDIIRKVTGKHLDCAMKCFPNKPEYQP